MGVYGLLNGPVNSIIGLPAIVTGAIAAAAVPAISSGKEANGKVGLALKLTFLIAMPCALGLLVFSQQVISLLYPTLSTEDAGLAALLLQVGSVSVPFLALLQTSVCVLVAARKGFLGTLNLFVGVLAKLALSFILLQIPSINIFGSAISAAACYLVVAALNLFVIMRHYKFEPSAHVALKPLLCSTVAIAFAFGAQKLFEVFLGQNLSLALSIALSLLVYAFACLKLEVLSGSEIGLLSLPRKVKVTTLRAYDKCLFKQPRYNIIIIMIYVIGLKRGEGSRLISRENPLVRRGDQDRARAVLQERGSGSGRVHNSRRNIPKIRNFDTLIPTSPTP